MRSGVVLVVLAVLAAACSSGGEAVTAPDPGRPETFTPGEVIRVEVERTSADVTSADLAAVVAADTALGLDIFALEAGSENFMISPYSIGTALSMLYPGAKGETASEIAAVMHLSVSDDALHGARNQIDTALTAPAPSSGEEDTREPFTISPANSAWGQGGYPFNTDYLTTLAENYGAGLRLVDYVGDPEGSRELINDWTSEATEDRINDLIPEGGITVDTRLALVNAIWFKANWAEKFSPEATKPGAFTLPDGTQVQVPLMHGGQRTGYADTDLYTAVRLPYAGDAAMMVMLPKQGTPAGLAAALSPEDLDITWGDYQVTVTLPPFEFDAELDLIPALSELGMAQAFEPPAPDSGADFTGITDARELFVSGAFHKSFIALDENGTEAAAATAIIFGVTSMPQPATFIADRPFLFWIEHSGTGEVLFLGQVTDPS